jgi:hypothetical protein
MRYLILFPIFILAGCASVQMPGYISRVDHPYDRKIYAGFEKVVSSTMFVLKNKGWTIMNGVEPSIYERDDRYDNNGYQNLLIITNIKKQFLHLTSTHLNVFIHSIGNTCDVQIRYEAQTPLIKQFISVRNDRLAQGILDAVEQETNG